MVTFTDDMTENEKITAVKEDMLNIAITQLGPLFKTDDTKVLENYRWLILNEALDICNMSESSNNLLSIEAIVVQAMIIAYQNRGAEGMASQNELGQNNTYIHWLDYLRDNLINSGKRYVQ